MSSRGMFAMVLFAGLVTFPACGGSGGARITSPPPIHNEWTWMSGADVVNQPGVYGTRGTPAASNVPGARVYPCSWTDSSGTFWLFGGYGVDSTNAANEGDLNDLWKYSGGEWTWVSGADLVEQQGSYGTMGVPAASNVPTPRYFAACWTDASGNFWFFGGLGLDSTGTRGQLNDLWKYVGGQWMWVSGADLADQPGVYGTKGTAAPDNTPGARVSASTWTDSSGSLWLFGGFGWDSEGSLGDFNDLWKYSGGEWTWMAGSDIADHNGAQQFGIYGTLGVPNPSNTPGARFGTATWTDAHGDFWLFGGDGEDVDGTRCQQTGPPCELSDLWRYSGGEWTWMGGPDQSNEPGVYGTEGVAAPDNVPGARDSAVSWVDAAGNFWLFGGAGPWDFNDLWSYSGGQWTWMSGSSQAGQTGIYGTLGTAAPGNVPGCRDGAAGWTDRSGNLWLFGGEEAFCVGNGKFNDLWEYQP